MQNAIPNKHGKMITHCFWFKINLSLDEEIQHCCRCFQLWFWKWNELFSSIMCTWERMCLEKIWNKNLAKFSTSCKFQMIKHCCFPTFLEVPSFVPLNSDVIFRFDFSPCINVCNPTLLLLWGWVLNACFHIKCISSRWKQVCLWTNHNYG